MRRHYLWGKKLICAVLCASLIIPAAGCAQGGNGDSAGGSGSATAGIEQAGTGEAQNGAGQSGSAQNGTEQTGAAQDGTAQEDNIENALRIAGRDGKTVTPAEKDETVYVKADPYGRPTETTAEVILSKIAGVDPVEDRSDLTDIKNTEGDEEYESLGEGRYVWENHGEDIHYKGISDRKIPVDVDVTYYLEGQEVTAEEIAGKTGEVRIRFDYENHTDVPFMALSAVLLSGDIFSDVEAENGRVIDFGDQKAVIGYAFPGLGSSLKLAAYEPTEEFELPEFVEITAHAEAFELDFTATVVSTGLFDEVEDEDLADLEDMADDMEELTDASKELKDAAGELADGGGEFGDYLSEYFDGISQISDGSDALDEGLMALAENIGAITEGSAALQTGLAQVDKSLSQIDLSELSSKESEAAAQAAAAALQSLGQNTAALGEKLAAVQAAAGGLATYREYLTAYGAQVEALKTAVGDNPAPVLSELAPEAASALNEEASAQANAVLKEAAQKAAEDAVEEAVSPAVEEGIAAGVEKIAAKVAETAAENAAQGTADAAIDDVREGIEESDALDSLGLTPEQIAAAKEQLIKEIEGRIETVPGDTSALASETASEVSGGISSEVAGRITDKINGGISVDPDAVEISLDELLAQTLAAMQEELDTRYGNIAAARDAVGELTLPDMSALSGEQVGGISGILTEMGNSLAVVSAYAQGISSSAESLKGLAAGMEKLKTGISELSEGSAKLAGGLELFKEALSLAAEGSGELSGALREVASAGGELDSAFSELVDGMGEFADGVSEFDEEGIQSLAELTGPEYLDVIRSVRAARDAEHSYTNFSGICEGQKGSVRFIIETEEISAGD